MAVGPDTCAVSSSLTSAINLVCVKQFFTAVCANKEGCHGTPKDPED